MRIADTGGWPKASIQDGKSDHIRQIERKKKLFRLSSFSLAGTPDERSSRLQDPLGMVIANYAPGCMWPGTTSRCMMTMARSRACVQLHVEKIKTKPGK